MKFNNNKISGLLLSMSLITALEVFSQKVAPESLDIWEPIPKVVSLKEGGNIPSDAIVLFSGKDLSNWKAENSGPAKWEVKDGAVTVVKGSGLIMSKQDFGDIQLHIEWRSPVNVKGDGQNRGNSGIFFQSIYELQVLDSYNNKTYVNGQAGSIYKDSPPLVNVCKKPGEWQSYDVIFHAPKFNTDSTLQAPARFTVLQNGVLIQDNVAIKGRTFYDEVHTYKAHGKAPLTLQDHGSPVSFRNIWVREL